ncbi:MAG: hypothetical protein ABIR32_03065 [Ilumatobacteraceae bacterium]
MTTAIDTTPLPTNATVVPAPPPTAVSAPVETVAPVETTLVGTRCGVGSTSIDVDGRAVLVRTPDSAGHAAVIIAVHGFKGTPEGLEYFSQLSLLTNAIVAYPSGVPLDLGFGWNSGAGRFATSKADDVAVLSDVVDVVLGTPCADPARVYLVGESNGGGMVLRAACDQRFTGRLSGLVLVNAAVDAGVLSTCADRLSTAPISVVAVAGLQDRIIQYDGGREPFPPVETWFSTVSERVAGCSGLPEKAPFSPTVEAITAPNCAACAVLYAISDGTHTWPGSFEGANGQIPGSFALTTTIAEVLDGTTTPCGT